MQTHKITDRDKWLELRKPNINSTESSALFGLSMPSQPTAFELYHIKRGEISGEIEDNAFMQWGRRLEDIIARGIAEDEGWEIFPIEDYIWDEQLHIGSSFDYEIITKDDQRALLEIKTTTYKEFKQKYIEDDDGEFIEAPEYYEFQCQHELEVFNKHDLICLAVYILDTRQYKLLWRERDRAMGKAIRNKVKWFWELETPPPVDLERDSAVFLRIQRANSSDKLLDAREIEDFDLHCLSYIQESEREKNAKKEKDKLKLQIAQLMGDCNAAYSEEYRVANKKQFRLTEVNK